jgi:hypothetical protein
VERLTRTVEPGAGEIAELEAPVKDTPRAGDTRPAAHEAAPAARETQP